MCVFLTSLVDDMNNWWCWKIPKKFKDVDVLDKKWTNIPVVINYMAKNAPSKENPSSRVFMTEKVSISKGVMVWRLLFQSNNDSEILERFDKFHW